MIGGNHSVNHSDGDGSQPDATMTMLRRLVDGSLCGLATYHLLKADLLMIRGLPETPSRPPAS
jgi:hypothetical protein